MPISKLNAFTQKVADLADKPEMTSSAFKAVFDAAPEELRVYLNSIVDALQSVVDGDSGADNIRVSPITGLTVVTVQAVLEALKATEVENRAYLLEQINGVALGQIPDGGVTPLKLSIDAKKAETITVADVSNKFTATNVEAALEELFTFANDGKIAVSDAVTAKGVAASPTDTFSALATKIGQISTGKKFATGTATSTNSNNIAVTGLSFKPRIVSFSEGTTALITASSDGSIDNSVKIGTADYVPTVTWGVSNVNIYINAGVMRTTMKFVAIE